MTLLEDLKEHLNNNDIKLPINFNFSSEKNENCIVLWQYDGTPNMLANNARVQITVKHSNMRTAEDLAVSIFDMLYPKGQYVKVIYINGKAMHIRPLQEPFYNERDGNKRHCYVFNINIDYDRK